MAKKIEQSRLTHDVSGVTVESARATDDSFLPTAAELAALKEVDPTAIEWIKARTEYEQKARIEFNQSQVLLAQNEQKKSYALAEKGLWAVYSIIIILLAVGVLLIFKGFEIPGIIITSGDIVGVLTIFAKIGLRQNR